MFHFLHRIYVLSWVTLIVAGVVWLYPRTGVSEPLLDWYAVWQNKPNPTARSVGELSGSVNKVMDAASFALRGSDGRLYSIGLLGVIPPAAGHNAAELRSAERGKALLKDLVLSNEVQVTLTWMDPHRRGVGIVYVGDTNVNAAMVQSGLVKLKPEFIRSVRWRDQYSLLRADRKARQHETASAEQP